MGTNWNHGGANGLSPIHHACRTNCLMGSNLYVLTHYIPLLIQNVYLAISGKSSIEAAARHGELPSRSRPLPLRSWEPAPRRLYIRDVHARQSALCKLSAATVSISSVLESPSSLVSFLASCQHCDSVVISIFAIVVLSVIGTIFMSYSKLPNEVRRMPHSLLTPFYEEESFNIKNIGERDDDDDDDGESQHKHACRCLQSLTNASDFALGPLANEVPTVSCFLASRPWP
jgi:hypothetical protein